MNGILIVDKEKNYTSRDIVNIVSKKLHTKKIGHTGTLDPIATGVLVLCINEGTKLVEIITSEEKEYIASVILGIKTDTLDITGNILEERKECIDKEEVKKVLNSFIGNYDQTVPIYSAVKIKGKKLYEYARENKEVILPTRNVEIKEIELIGGIKYNDSKTQFQFRCVVSKGTYIRSLINDIALKLNTVGIMSDLRRIRQGNFKINESYTLEQIQNNEFHLVSITDCLNDFNTIIVDETLEFKIKNGRLLENIYTSNEVLFKNQNNELLAIYKTYEKDHQFIKPWKMFKGGKI